MKQKTPKPNKVGWIIIENTIKNEFGHKTFHRLGCQVKHVNHDGLGITDYDTGLNYKYAFDNKVFGTETGANKYLAKWFMRERQAIKSLLKSMDTFEEANPELMI